MSPSSSARGTSAATESMTRTSIAPDRTSDSVISSACSPESGCEIKSSLILTPSFSAYSASIACSASMYAAIPPFRCASATTWRASVVFPELSGPKTSTTLPRGRPPIPTAASMPMLVVETAGISSMRCSPSRMIAPLPKFFSICASAASMALFFSFRSLRSLLFSPGFSFGIGTLFPSLWTVNEVRDLARRQCPDGEAVPSTGQWMPRLARASPCC